MKFQGLENVEICDAGRLSGTIVEIREYGKGIYRYIVSGSLSGDDDVDGIYDEEQLQSLRTFASSEEFRIPGGLSIGQVVKVKSSVSDNRLSGSLLIISGRANPRGSAQFVEAYSEDLDEYLDIDVSSVSNTFTTARLPPTPEFDVGEPVLPNPPYSVRFSL